MHQEASRSRIINDTRMAKAMGHPLRVRALEILNQRVASPSEIARELDMPLPNVVYHVNCLLRLKCIEEVETRQVRGALEHRYRAVRRVVVLPDEWAHMPASAQESFEGQWMRRAFGDFRDAVESGSFARRLDRHMSWTPLVLDEQAWREMYEAMKNLLELALSKEAESMARLRNGASGGPEVRSRLTMLHYEAPDVTTS
ncbi:MAG TPA: winged helix-turn-helix domain-containing protein [Capillimicrobium sp.]|nr:winged helix-turn-helix domain-containing protein [Capillimicrobium sp.]